MTQIPSASTFTHDSRTLSYTCEGEGPLVVCVPGGPGMDPQAYFSALELPGFCRLVLAPRGTGASDPPASPAGYRMAGYVEDLEALRGHLDAEALTLYGASHGGAVALAYATAHPDRVQRLILSGPPARLDADFEAALARARHRFAYGLWDGLDRLAASDAATAALEGELFPTERRARLRVMFSRYVASQGPSQSAYLDGLCAAPLNPVAFPIFSAERRAGLDLLVGAERVTAPTLVLAGHFDVVIPAEASQVVAQALPAGRYREIPDAGHFSDADAPAVVRDEILAFLSSPLREAA